MDKPNETEQVLADLLACVEDLLEDDSRAYWKDAQLREMRVASKLAAYHLLACGWERGGILLDEWLPPVENVTNEASNSAIDR